MRDGGLQQLILVVVFLVFAVVDLLARWARRRQGPSDERDDRERIVFPPDEEDEPFGFPRDARDQGRAAEVQRSRDQAAARQESRGRGAAAREEARLARERAAMVRDAILRAAPVRGKEPKRAPAASRVAAGPAPARGRAGRFSAADARRAVIAMTVLGPCRGLEGEREG